MARNNRMAVTTDAVAAVATASGATTFRGSCVEKAAIAAAASKGTTTGIGTSWSIGSALHGVQVPGVERPGALVGLEGQRQDQSDDREPHHAVGEHEGLHDRVDRPGPDGDVLEDLRRPAVHVPDLEYQYVRGGLHHLEAHGHVDEVPGGHDAVQADQEQPPGQQERRRPHEEPSRRGASNPRGLAERTMKVCSMNSHAMNTKPAATSRPTTRLMMRRSPPENTEPGCPSPMTFAR